MQSLDLPVHSIFTMKEVYILIIVWLSATATTIASYYIHPAVNASILPIVMLLAIVTLSSMLHCELKRKGLLVAATVHILCMAYMLGFVLTFFSGSVIRNSLGITLLFIGLFGTCCWRYKL